LIGDRKGEGQASLATEGGDTNAYEIKKKENAAQSARPEGEK